MSIGGQGIVLDYFFAEFGDFRFSRFWFYRADRHTDRITDADDRLTHATTVCMSKEVTL